MPQAHVEHARCAVAKLRARGLTDEAIRDAIEDFDAQPPPSAADNVTRGLGQVVAAIGSAATLRAVGIPAG